MSRHEAPEVGSAVTRMMNGLIRRAADGDLEAVEALAEIEAFAPNATNAALALAHARAGYSFGELSAVTGTSRAAVQQRVARAVARRVCHLSCIGMRKCRG